MPRKIPEMCVNRIKRSFAGNPLKANRTERAKKQEETMRNGNRRIKMLATLLAAVVLEACAVPAQAEKTAPYDGSLRIADGTLLPMCE